jgi:uncharacterized membrane-anchored protein
MNETSKGAGAELRSLRNALSNEWHARPQLGLPAPLRGSHVVCLRGKASVRDSRAAFGDFCRDAGQAGPGKGSRHHSVQIGACLTKWEGHTEADSFTMLVSGNGEPPFSTTALDFLDTALREQLLDNLFVGVHLEVLQGAESDSGSHRQRLRGLLGTEALYGGTFADERGEIWSSFRLDASGFIRLLIIDRGLGEARLSRFMQRLLELESYRMLAMLALPRAREVMVQLSELEPELDAVMSQLAESSDEAKQEEQLRTLSGLAARVEHIVAANAYRFAAARAYTGIVERRIAELREEEVGAAPRYSTFLLKSLLPAMRTCDAAEQRTHELAQRVTRATQLLNSMVDMVQSKQNQEILEGMAERATLQLRLQQSVEGFSIFAITYYAVGLLGYLLKSTKLLGLKADPELLTGLAAPLILAVVWLSVRSVKKRLRRKGPRADHEHP